MYKAYGSTHYAISGHVNSGPDVRVRIVESGNASIAGPGMNPRHVDTILVKNYYDFFSENLGINSTRDRYREHFLSRIATILKKKLKKKSASCT